MILNRRRAQQKKQKGLTLVEMMVVIVILGLVSGLIFVMVAPALDQSKVSTTETQIKQLQNSLDMYLLTEGGEYPSESEGLAALVEAGVLPKVPQDAWNNDFIYRRDGRSYEIVSLGADQREGGDGIDADISSNQ